jgi:hypothetical protein
VRTGWTPFAQLSREATSIDLEFFVDGKWVKPGQIKWESGSGDDVKWTVQLDELPFEAKPDTKVRLALMCGVKKGEFTTAGLLGRYKLENLSFGVHEVSNALRRRRFVNVAEAELIFDEATQEVLESIKWNWSATLADISSEIELEFVALSKEKVSGSTAVDVGPGMIVAMSTTVVLKTDRNRRPGSSLFEYRWINFQDPTNVYATNQLFAVDLDEGDTPVVYLNSAMNDVRGILTLSKSQLAKSTAEVKNARKRADRLLVLQIAGSVSPSVVMRILEVSQSVIEDLDTPEEIGNLDFEGVFESLSPSTQEIAKAWSDWMSPSGLVARGDGVTLCREVFALSDRGKPTPHLMAFIHDQLPRQMRQHFKAELPIAEIVGEAVTAKKPADISQAFTESEVG